MPGYKFVYIGTKDLENPPEDDSIKKKQRDLFSILMRAFSKVKEPSQLDMNLYSVVHASPSVVPNPYLPSLRIWGYNISEMNDAGLKTDPSVEQVRKGKAKHSRPNKKRCKRREDKHKWWCQLPERPWHSDENAPSRRNGPLSPLGYSQVRVKHQLSTACFTYFSYFNSGGFLI
jgi:endopolyphosphatase